MIISKVPGEPLNAQWSCLPDPLKLHVKWKIGKAVDILRSLGSVCVDAGKHNVLFAPLTGRVTMIDFEVMQAVDGTVGAEAPEMLAIFGREVIGGGMDTGQRHAGG